VKLKKKYTSLNETLRYMRLQIAEGLNYAEINCPRFTNAAELFYWLKPRLVYKHDPQNIELLQSLPTLLNAQDNYWRTAGAGDCDCFVIAALTLFNTSDIKGRAFIKLAGRSKSYPVHIWCGVENNGEEVAIDLTERTFNTEREYPYIQKLYFKPL
jgi:hypothetical protein